MNKKAIFEVLAYGYPGKGTDGRPFGWSSCALVITEEANIVIDAGSYSSRGAIIKKLKTFGLEPHDIDMVLLTHLHHDHIQNIDLFPQAEFLLNKDEWDYALKTTDMPYQKPILIPLISFKKRFINDGEIIASGVSAMLTLAHTPGSMSYLIQTEKERIIFCGDAIKNRLELRTGDVDMTYDEQASKESIANIIASCDKVLMGHDGIYSVKGGALKQVTETRMILCFREGITCNNGKKTVAAILDD
jgi:glyoxylase-like metal-dependent hydrolase (beta-lactamase superfamily II)